jgi:hypothetical protein
MSAACECCLLSCRSLCDGPITRLQESYGMWYVSVIDKPHRGGLDQLGQSSHKSKLDLSDNVPFILEVPSSNFGCLLIIARCPLSLRYDLTRRNVSYLQHTG